MSWPGCCGRCSGSTTLDDEAARAQVRPQVPGAQTRGSAPAGRLARHPRPTVPPPDIAPDARRRRLTALVNAASLARTRPGVYVIEDVHWIDEVSESMLADFLSVVPQTRSLVLITYRPEYHGALSRTAGRSDDCPCAR